MREAQQLRIQQDQKRQSREKRVTKPRPPIEHAGQGENPSQMDGAIAAANEPVPEKIDAESHAPRYRSNNDANPMASKIPVPSVRTRSSEEEQLSLDAELAGADLDGLDRKSVV